MNSKNNILVPFCIYHYIEPNTGLYAGYIGMPNKIRNENGEEYFECKKEKQVFGKWYLAGTFYAVSPMFRPIPYGMKMFCAKKAGSFPYNTTNVSMNYDPYNTKKDCVYFTTYSQPVPNTVPLYFHFLNENVYPSFDRNPPSDDINWTQTEISPVYVMTNSSLNIEPNNLKEFQNLKFQCINGRCIPFNRNLKDVYLGKNDKQELLPLEDCLLYCSELVVDNASGSPNSLLASVAADSKNKFTLSRFIKKIPSWLISIILSLFAFILFCIFIFVLRKKN